MNHPATRILAVLELLQTHGRLSGAELGERIEVDRRTIRRYIAVLEEIGIPSPPVEAHWAAMNLSRVSNFLR